MVRISEVGAENTVAHDCIVTYPSRSPPDRQEANERRPDEELFIYSYETGSYEHAPTEGSTTQFLMLLKEHILSIGGFPTARTLWPDNIFKT